MFFILVPILYHIFYCLYYIITLWRLKMFSFQAFISYACAVTFTPGPNNIMCMMNGNQHGLKKTLRFIAGIVIGYLIILSLACFFNLFLFEQLPKIQPFMRLLGASYMLYLVSKIMDVHLFSNVFKKRKKVTKDPVVLNFTTGITLQFVNIKAILFAITITSGFIIPYFNTPIMLILFSLLLASITFMATVLWTVFGSLFNKFLATYSRPFNMAMSALLIYSALSILGLFH